MISKVSVHNFKCLRDVQIDLERFTIFVGANASGKSSVLQAIDLLCRIFSDGQGANSAAEIPERVSRGATGKCELAAELGGIVFRYLAVIPAAPVTHKRNQRAPWGGEGRGVASSLAATEWKQWGVEPQDAITLPRSVLLQLESSKLVETAAASPNLTQMAPNGLGLHSALASMALNDPDSWQSLQSNLRQIIPTIVRLRHTSPPTIHQPAALLFDTIGAASLPANQVSEGTLLVLGLLAALHGSNRPSLILLDDLDRGLHPKAQKELITLLRALLETNADLQIIATTHSPYMLDCTATNEVRMTYLREDGSTVCAPLANHPKFEQWKDEMAPGEMWSLFGEKWLAGQEAPT